MNNTFPTEGNLSGLSRKDFQKEINNKETDLFILKNKKGMEVAVTNYGCAILAIMVPDKDGKYEIKVQSNDILIFHKKNYLEEKIFVNGKPSIQITIRNGI